MHGDSARHRRRKAQVSELIFGLLISILCHQEEDVWVLFSFASLRVTALNLFTTKFANIEKFQNA